MAVVLLLLCHVHRAPPASHFACGNRHIIKRQLITAHASWLKIKPRNHIQYLCIRLLIVCLWKLAILISIQTDRWSFNTLIFRDTDRDDTDQDCARSMCYTNKNYIFSIRPFDAIPIRDQFWTPLKIKFNHVSAHHLTKPSSSSSSTCGAVNVNRNKYFNRSCRRGNRKQHFKSSV